MMLVRYHGQIALLTSSKQMMLVRYQFKIAFLLELKQEKKEALRCDQ